MDKAKTYQKDYQEDGFTLMEILIAVTITGIVMSTIILFMNQALFTWERMEDKDSVMQNRSVLESRLKKDLLNLVIFDFYDEPQFVYNYEYLEFLIFEDDTLKRVRYSMDSYNNCLLRNTLLESEMDNKSFFNINPQEGLKFFEKIDMQPVNFEFYDSELKSWVDVWSDQDKGYMPTMLRITIFFEDNISLSGHGNEMTPLVFEVFAGRKYNFKKEDS